MIVPYHPKTPYHRLLGSSEITKKKKQELKEIYQSLNPAQLKRTIDERLKELHKINQKVDVKKKVSVRFSTTSSKAVSV
ncbi:MAG: hypothetical protein AAGT88_07570 [Dethiobacter sp.]